MSLMSDPFEFYFSHSQFMVYDASVELPGCKWTEAHSRQGFARRESTACLGALLEFGHARVEVDTGPFVPRPEDERVISIPFFAKTGRVVVSGPEEDIMHLVRLGCGHRRLTVAQSVVNDEPESIRLTFERVDEPDPASRILKSDPGWTPPSTLLEDAEIA